MTTPDSTSDRRPLVAAAKRNAPAPTVVGGAITAAFVLLSLTRGQIAGVDVYSILLGAGAVLSTVGTALSTVTRVVQDGERDVTPVTSPRGPDGEPLVSRTTAILDEVLEHLAQLQQLDAALEPPTAAAAEPPDVDAAAAAPATAPLGLLGDHRAAPCSDPYGGYYRDDLGQVDQLTASSSAGPMGRHRDRRT